MSPNLKLGSHGADLHDQRPSRGKWALDVDTDLSSPSIYKAYREEYESLCSYAQTMVGSRDLAQDVVQQAFANTLSAVARGAIIRNAAGFLNRCVRNLALDYEREQPVLSLNDELHRMAGASTAASAEIKDRWHQVESVVEDMVPSQRHAFLLAEVRGLGYEEIASRMGCSTDAVRMLLCRARRRIRSVAGVEQDVGSFLPILTAQPVLLNHGQAAHSGAWEVLKAKLSELQSWIGGAIGQGVEPLMQPVAQVAAIVAIAASPVGLMVVRGSTPSSNAGAGGTGSVLHSISRTEYVTVQERVLEPSGNRASSVGPTPTLDRNNPSETGGNRGDPQSEDPPDNTPEQGSSANLPKREGKKSDDGYDGGGMGPQTEQFPAPPDDPGCPTCRTQEAPTGGGGSGGDPDGGYGQDPNGGGDPNGGYEEAPAPESPSQTEAVEEPVGGGEGVVAPPVDTQPPRSEDPPAPAVASGV